MKYFFIVTIASLPLWMGCKSEPVEISPPAKVEVMTVTANARPELYEVSGRVAPADETVASFKTGGFVHVLRVDEGDRFREGEMLAALDTTEVAALVRVATQQREKLERDFQRVEKLYAEKVVSLEQFQNIQTALTAARADEERGIFALQRSVIRAPFDGVVAARYKNLGEMIDAGHPLLRLVSRGELLKAKLTVPARFINAVSRGDSVRLRFDEVSRDASGIVREVGAVAVHGTGHYELEIDFAADAELREGMAVRAWIPGPVRDVIALPTSALVSGDEDRGRIFIVRDSQASLISVDFAGFNHDSLLVRATLPPASRVIVSGAGFLRDGQRVEIVESAE